MLEARDRIGGRVWVQRDALGGLDLDMGGAWVADCQPSVWAEADRYGVAREHDPLPARMRWVLGGERIDRAWPVGTGDLGELERVGRRAARRGAAPRPGAPARRAGARGPRRPRLGVARRPGRRRAACASSPTCGSPRAAPRPVADVSMLEFLRWISAADWSVWRHLEAAVLGLALPRRDGRALRGDRRRRARARSELGTPVVAIAQDGGAARRSRRRTGGTLRADAVVVTVPIGALARDRLRPAARSRRRRGPRRRTTRARA